MIDVEISTLVKPAKFNNKIFKLTDNNLLKQSTTITAVFFLKNENILLVGELKKSYIVAFDLTNGKIKSTILFSTY